MRAKKNFTNLKKKIDLILSSHNYNNSNKKNIEYLFLYDYIFFLNKLQSLLYDQLTKK